MNSETQFAVENIFEELVEDICALLQAGTEVDIERLADEHPEIGEQLRKVFPALVALNRLDESCLTAESSTQPENAKRNQPLGDFRIIRQIARGGMGVVYEAEQLSIKRRVALKVLPLASLIDSRALIRFRNEVAAIATLEHPHIVSVYAVGEDRGIHYYAMKLIHGQNLSAVIRELRTRADQNESISGEMIGQVVSEMELEEKGSGTFCAEHPEGRSGKRVLTPFVETRAMGRSATAGRQVDQAYIRNVVRLISQAADALQHAHDHGIIHRDVKPGNILLDIHGALFVTDFGLARIEAGAGVTMTGDVLGTLRYMSPEQVLANRVLIDHRTDIYSLGATLYELLTLHPMWSGEDKPSIIRQISFEEPTRPQKLNPAIPIDLETIVLKAISKNPNDRYDSSQAFGEDLQRFLDSKTIQARRATMSKRLTKWAMRHRAIVALAIVAICILAVTLSGSAVVIWNESQSRLGAVLEKQSALLDAAESNKRMETINDFVIKTIVQSANPLSNAGSRDITVRNSLLTANELIDETFKDDPVLMAHVKSNFADYFDAIGEYKAARKNLEDALHIFERVFGRKSRNSIDVLSKLTKVFRNLGELDLALSTGKEVLELSEGLYGKHDQQAVSALFDIGTVFSRRKNFSQASQTLGEVIDLSQSRKFRLLEALATNELGNVSFNQQKYGDAEMYWSNAMSMFDVLESPMNVIVAKYNLSNVFWETGRLDESIALAKQVFKQVEERCGPTHPRTLDALLKLAVRQHNKDNGSIEAIEGFRQLVARTHEKYGPRNEKTAEAMRELGTVLVTIGQFDEAIELQNTAFEIVEEEFGEHHSKVIVSLNALASTYIQMGDIDNATKYYQAAIDGRLMIASQIPSDFDNAVSLGGLYCDFGVLCRNQIQDLEKALRCFTQAIDVLEEVNRTSPTIRGRGYLSTSYFNRALTLGEMKQWDMALTDSDQAILHATTPGLMDGKLLWKARLMAMSGDVTGAVLTVDDVLTRREGESDMFILAAATLALCAAELEKPASANDASSRTEFDYYAVRSVQLLEKAESIGHFRLAANADKIRKETDFDRIRRLDAFEALMKRISEASEQERRILQRGNDSPNTKEVDVK